MFMLRKADSIQTFLLAHLDHGNQKRMLSVQAGKESQSLQNCSYGSYCLSHILTSSLFISPIGSHCITLPLVLPLALPFILIVTLIHSLSKSLRPLNHPLVLLHCSHFAPEEHWIPLWRYYIPLPAYLRACTLTSFMKTKEQIKEIKECECLQYMWSQSSILIPFSLVTINVSVYATNQVLQLLLSPLPRSQCCWDVRIVGLLVEAFQMLSESFRHKSWDCYGRKN